VASLTTCLGVYANNVEEAVAKRPSRIILVRHGESEGNVDESVYRRKADNKIELTEHGKEQARAAGRRIMELIGDDNVYFYASPYKRAEQTLYEIGRDFPRDRILGVREDARLREQDFGNFQDEHMRGSKEARKRFSRFFFRFRDGESAADVYDRVTTFRETLRHDIDYGRFGGENSDRPVTVVIVTHGLTLRVFLMRWYKWTVEMFERVYNPSNAGLVIMEGGSGGRYSLAVHHSVQILTKMGFSKEMIEDQIWHMTALPGDRNLDWPTSGPAFFDCYEQKMREEQEQSDDYGDMYDETVDISELPGHNDARLPYQ